MSRPDDIVGYTFQADLYCPSCILRELHGSPTGEPPIAGMTIEHHLDIVAWMRSVDRHDESSFDSGEFPKVLFRSMLTTIDCPACVGGKFNEDGCDRCGWAAVVTGERCGRCGEELGE